MEGTVRLVRTEGVEPSPRFQDQILSLARLPIPPRSRKEKSRAGRSCPDSTMPGGTDVPHRPGACGARSGALRRGSEQLRLFFPGGIEYNEALRQARRLEGLTGFSRPQG